MTIMDGKIAMATESELYSMYLRKGFDDLFPFDEYKRRCIANGTKIIEERDDSNERNATIDEFVERLKADAKIFKFSTVIMHRIEFHANDMKNRS
jgi:hypothetical protein